MFSLQEAFYSVWIWLNFWNLNDLILVNTEKARFEDRPILVIVWVVPYLRKWSNLTIIFFRWVGQPPTNCWMFHNLPWFSFKDEISWNQANRNSQGAFKNPPNAFKNPPENKAFNPVIAGRGGVGHWHGVTPSDSHHQRDDLEGIAPHPRCESMRPSP